MDAEIGRDRKTLPIKRHGTASGPRRVSVSLKGATGRGPPAGRDQDLENFAGVAQAEAAVSPPPLGRRCERKGGAYASPSPKRHTGMPNFLALSQRLPEMPDPGNDTRPIGIAASKASLRLKGAALA